MKGKDIIDLIKKRGLEDFELVFSFADGFDVFPNIRSFEKIELSDIGYSEKVLIIEGVEINK